MEVIAFVLLVSFIAIVIIVNAFYRAAKKSDRNRLYVLPDLGIQNHSEAFKRDMLAFIDHLEESLSESYVERVKERVIREHKISLMEWENRWFEWKRYLVMTALLKSVPMYSREVDEVWHEMLMFTREYDDFSKKFLKTMLHHAPNAPAQSFDPHERAWFDVIYALLFKPTKYSISTWGPFMKHPLSKTLMSDLQNRPLHELTAKYFNEHAMQHFPVVSGLVRFIVDELKNRLSEIDKHVRQQGTKVNKFAKNRAFHAGEPDLALWMLNGVLFLSLVHSDHFEELYEEMFPRQSSSHGSGCSAASGCSSCTSGDSGGSSCSSSSCGGGGGCGGGS
ncbi:hypothetical protein [Lihuaxuella thermophila]|uniref:Uncharacterized protein n=1 Tax=Lihuaxuella thermophila TaxID=1173111 RepID=A0A1H8C1B0_9BACL|nr:hypothetical protein [Lihuaxuella thermophila]SEM88895.1 hypothetical protein SAMN05444955_10318 [Lihuaxuella thermophila]